MFSTAHPTGFTKGRVQFYRITFNYQQILQNPLDLNITGLVLAENIKTLTFNQPLKTHLSIGFRFQNGENHPLVS